MDRRYWPVIIGVSIALALFFHFFVPNAFPAEDQDERAKALRIEGLVDGTYDNTLSTMTNFERAFGAWLNQHDDKTFFGLLAVHRASLANLRVHSGRLMAELDEARKNNTRPGWLRPGHPEVKRLLDLQKDAHASFFPLIDHILESEKRR